MTIKTVIDDLLKVYGALPNPYWVEGGTQSQLVTAKRFTEHVNAEDFPLVMVGIDWTKENHFNLTQSEYHHHFWLSVWMFVGGPGTELEELHQRAELCTELLVVPTYSYLHNSSHFPSVGEGTKDNFMPYKVGLWPITDKDQYFGSKTSLLVYE